ncbi:MAG: hypothetical protein ACRD9L_17215, partial [Bryobacteraceae bacterium]
PRAFDFRPEIVFYQSGVDALDTDALGRLSLSAEGLCLRDRQVITAARSHGAPFVVTLGGGYARPIEHTVAAHANTYRTAAAVFGEGSAPPPTAGGVVHGADRVLGGKPSGISS